MLAASGYVGQVDPDLCEGCGLCVDRCQFEASGIMAGVAVADAASCMGCGVCVSTCAKGAPALVHNLAKGVPLELCELLVDGYGVAGDEGQATFGD